MRRMMYQFCQVCWLALLLAACSSPPAEQQVRQAIAQAAEAAEQTDAGALREVVSEDFVGNRGSMDARQLLNILRVQRLRQQQVGVTLGPVSVESHGDRLTASFTVSLSGGRGALPDRLGIYSVQTAWREEDGEWRCYTASWERKI